MRYKRYVKKRVVILFYSYIYIYVTFFIKNKVTKLLIRFSNMDLDGMRI